METNLTPIIGAIVTLLCAIITTFVIPWLKQKIGNEKLIQVSEWVTIAVQAAEQIYAGTGRGKEKKEYVLKFLQSKGLKVDPDSLDNMIESAVYNLQQSIITVEDEKEIISI